MLLCISSVFPVIPHTMRMPLWLPLLYVTLTVWRAGAARLQWPLPGKNHRWLYLLQHGLSVIGVLGVYFHYSTLFGRDPGIALLVMLLGFKIIETRQERDFYIVICLGLILVITNFFYSQSLLTAVYMTVAVVAQIACLIAINDHNRQLHWKHKLGLSASILLYSIPLMLVMFFLFPRIDGPMWGMPKDSHGASTGLDDKMTPGNISSLLQSDDIAFRVKFLQNEPGLRDMYWRGPVMWDFDGKTWTQNKNQKYPRSPLRTVRGQPVRYEITQEPNQRNWLFALEMPVSPDVGRLTADYQLLSKKTLQKRFRYTLTSYTEFSIKRLTETERQMALQLADGFHPRARQLAKQWLQQGLKEQEVVDKALEYFNQQGFYYSLIPPAVAEDSVDQFLFDTKTGFCEHFSSSFVVLMRAAGIPARVVTGYQGANYNPVGEYHIVYQRDAHAWAEVWLQDSGWQRIDPTAAVSPERILQGIENALPDIDLQTPFNLNHQSVAYQLLKSMRNNWDAINNIWNQWVITYNAERQRSLMEDLGFETHDWKALGAIMFIAISVILAVLAVMIIMKSKAASDPITRYYERFCDLMKKHGTERLAYEGPLNYAERLVRQHPAWSGSIEAFIDAYVGMRYGQQQAEPDELKQQFKRLKERTLKR